MFQAPIYERDWRPSCIVRRSSSSLVVSGARTAIRVTTAVSSLLKLRLLVGEILTNSEDHYSTPMKSLNCTLFPKFGWRSGCLRTWHMACPSSMPTVTSGEEESARVAAADAVGIVASSAAGGGVTEKWEAELPSCRQHEFLDGGRQ